MPRGPSCRLQQRRFATQEAFLIGIQDAHQAHLGKVKAFAQQVDAYQDVEVAGSQRTQNLNTLDGVDLTVQVPYLEVEIAKVVGEVLSGALRERGHENA